MSNMFNPPHPGGIVKESMEHLGLGIRSLAKALNVSPATVQRIIAGKAAISPEMSIRLETVIGSTADTWMHMQTAYDLWQVRQNFDTSSLQPLRSL